MTVPESSGSRGAGASSAPRGDELVLSVLGAGEVLGELSVIDQGPRSATAEALGDVELLAVAAADVRALLEDQPTLLLAAAAELAGTVRRLTGSAADLVFLDLGGRIAKLLLRLSEEHGHWDDDGSLILDLRLSQTDLAQMVGASRPAVNRVLQSLATRGFVSIDGHVIAIHDSKALQRRAGL